VASQIPHSDIVEWQFEGVMGILDW